MRKQISTISALLLAVVFAGGCSAPAEPDHEAMISGAEALDQAFQAAFNAGDADALAKTYWKSPDLVSFSPGAMVEHGHEEVTGSWAAFLESAPGTRLELTDIEHVVAGEYVISWGLWNMSIPTPDGSAQEMSGRFTDVKAEKDGKWVYVHDHASVPLPPTAEAEAMPTKG